MKHERDLQDEKFAEKVKLDLTNPMDCREFLKGLTAMNKEGKAIRITAFRTNEGRVLNADGMSDSEAIQFAKQMYEELYLPAQRAAAKRDNFEA